MKGVKGYDPNQSPIESQRTDPQYHVPPANPRSQPDLRLLRNKTALDRQTPLPVRVGEELSASALAALNNPPRPVVTTPEPITYVPHFAPDYSATFQLFTWYKLVPANERRRALSIINSYSPFGVDPIDYTTLVAFGSSQPQLLGTAAQAGFPIYPPSIKTSGAGSITRYTGNTGILNFPISGTISTQDVFFLVGSNIAGAGHAVMAYEGIDASTLAPG